MDAPYFQPYDTPTLSKSLFHIKLDLVTHSVQRGYVHKWLLLVLLSSAEICLKLLFCEEHTILLIRQSFLNALSFPWITLRRKISNKCKLYEIGGGGIIPDAQKTKNDPQN